MRRYALSEIVCFSLLGGALLLFYPDSFLAVYFSVVLTYFLLQLLSAGAFCLALYRGAIREHGPAPYRYSVAPGHKPDWLVMRHMWSYLRF